MRVELHIGEIVLVGVELPVGGEAQLRRAVQGELTALLTVDGPMSRLIDADHIAHLATNDVGVGPGPASADTLGRDISRSLHRGLTR